MREASIWKKKKKVLWAVGKEGCFKAVEKRFFFQILSKIHWWRNMIMRQKPEVFSILIVIITEMHKSCKTGIWKLSVYIFFLSNKEGDLGTNHRYIYKGNHRKDFHSRGEFWVNQNIFELELNREDECLFSTNAQAWKRKIKTIWSMQKILFFKVFFFNLILCVHICKCTWNNIFVACLK